MSIIEILVYDEMIDLMTSKKDDLVFVSNPSTNQFSYKLYDLDSGEISTIQSANDKSIEHNEFSFNLDNLAYINKFNNYNL